MQTLWIKYTGNLLPIFWSNFITNYERLFQCNNDKTSIKNNINELGLIIILNNIYNFLTV